MDITFATLLIPPYWEKETLILAESLRTLGGPLSKQPLIVLHLPDKPPPPDTAAQLHTLDAELRPFELDTDAQGFPLAVIPFGAAAAEKAAQTELLAWLLPDTFILNPPLNFELSDQQKLGCRPVHHQNIGSDFNQPPDAFWQLIFSHCQVPQERIFRMETCYREVVRPYLNAGMLVCRPQDGLLQTWLEIFRQTYQHPDFTPFYSEQKYAIFMHQAVLSGVVLNRYLQDQIAELPESYNYPLHMHDDYPSGGRISRLGELHTARFENNQLLAKSLVLFETDPQKDWIKDKLAKFEGNNNG